MYYIKPKQNDNKQAQKNRSATAILEIKCYFELSMFVKMTSDDAHGTSRKMQKTVKVMDVECQTIATG